LSSSRYRVKLSSVQLRRLFFIQSSISIILAFSCGGFRKNGRDSLMTCLFSAQASPSDCFSYCDWLHLATPSIRLLPVCSLCPSCHFHAAFVSSNAFVFFQYSNIQPIWRPILALPALLDFRDATLLSLIIQRVCAIYFAEDILASAPLILLLAVLCCGQLHSLSFIFILNPCAKTNTSMRKNISII